jgi:hypothetical protein
MNPMNTMNRTGNGLSIAEMGGGTPITQLRRDVPKKQVEYEKEESKESQNNIKYLVDEINNDSDIGPKKNKDSEEETTTEEEVVIKKPKKKKSESKYKIPDMIKDPILIWLIYILMSQNFFKNLIGKYVKTINPNEEGVVTFTGVAMYGLILVVFFTLVKFILQQLDKY